MIVPIEPGQGEQLQSVQRRVAQGHYEVSSERVAAAVLERVCTARAAREVLVKAAAGDRGLQQAMNVRPAA